MTGGRRRRFVVAVGPLAVLVVAGCGSGQSALPPLSSAPRIVAVDEKPPLSLSLASEQLARTRPAPGSPPRAFARVVTPGMTWLLGGWRSNRGLLCLVEEDIGPLYRLGIGPFGQCAEPCDAICGLTTGFLNRKFAFVGAVARDADQIVLRTNRGLERHRLTGPLVTGFPDRRAVIVPTAGYSVEVALLRHGRVVAHRVEPPLVRCYYQALFQAPPRAADPVRCLGLALPQGPGP